MKNTTNSPAAEDREDRSAAATFVSAPDEPDAGGNDMRLDRDDQGSVVESDGDNQVLDHRDAAGDPDDPDDPDDDDDDDDDDEDDDDEVEGEPGADAAAAEPEDDREAPTESDLFRQSEIAADYIEGLLDILDFDGDIDELVQNGRPIVEVVGARLNNLVGTRGATLEALQELSRLAVYRQTGEPSRLLLDVGGFRASRRKELVAVAKNAAEKVKRHGESVRLEPMSAFERKCVHDVINATTGVQSESEGVEPSRRIVIRSAGA